MEQKNENVDILKKEIELVLDRNKDENYLKSLLTRALILYIAGYAEGCRDKPTRKRRKAEKTNGEKEARL